MPTTANTITYYVAADGMLRDGAQGSIAQTPRINYGTEYAVTLSFPASTIAEGDQLQVALNRTRTFFSSASATGDAPVAAVAKHDVTAAEADAQAVTLTLSTNTRAMIDQVNGIDHPVRGFFGVHVLRGQSFVTLAVADALMMSLESGPDAISPPLPILDYPTRQEMNDAVHAAETAAENAQTSEDNAETYAGNAADEAQAARTSANAAGNSATLAKSYAVGGTGTRPGEDTDNAKYYLGQLGDHEAQAKAAAQAAAGSATAAAGSAIQAATAAGNAAGSVTQAGQAATAATTAKNAAETAQGKAEAAQGKAEQAQAKAEQAQGAAETAQTAAETAQGKAEVAQGLAEDAQSAAETARDAAVAAKGAAETAEANAAKIAEGTDEEVAPLGLERSAKGWAEEASERMTVITIPAATTTYSLQDNKHYQQVPSAEPTYTLPVVTMDGLVHEITVLVDFLHVTSCSFVDASDVPVTLQSSISPSIGEAYIFRCYWYGKWRVVPLKIRNAATASSATGVVEVSDAVAGDALALKMVAPRSVVVNQQLPTADIANWKAYNSSYGTLTAENGELTYECILTEAPSLYNYGLRKTEQGEPPAAGHVYACIFDWKVSNTGLDRVTLDSGLGVSSSTDTTYPTITLTGITANTWINHLFMKGIGRSYGSLSGLIYPVSSNGVAATLSTWAVGDKYSIRNYMLVDLTQYFNGDQALIDSITSWDDLVAYDPRFASYVEYNTGEVVGVQPTVKVTGKNLIDQSVWQSLPDSSSKGYNLIPCKAGQTFHIKFTPNGTVPQYIYLYLNINGRSVDITNYSNLTNKYITAENLIKNDFSFTLASTFLGGYFTIYHALSSGSQEACNTYMQNLQVELGSSTTSYEPYHDGGTAQAPAPLFAVGNAADEYEAVQGVTTRKMASVDLGTLNWGARGSKQGSFAVSLSTIKGGLCGLLVSSKLTVRKSAWYVDDFDNYPDNYIGKNNSTTSRELFLKMTSCATVEEFKSAISGVLLYYELATPTTSQSTPTQITLQAGNNTAMQTDGGRTLVELVMTYENLPAAN